MDRNACTCLIISTIILSLSARRAWIEIVAWLDYSEELLVALRKESVDRNIVGPSAYNTSRSLSARRAWIEMCARLCTYIQRYRRSPQGERG